MRVHEVLAFLLLPVRYGVEPPVLVKLEKEIELEESLLMASDPAPPIKTFTVCCQHGGLHQSVSSHHGDGAGILTRQDTASLRD